MAQVSLTPIHSPRSATFFSSRQLVLIACSGALVLAGLSWFIWQVKNRAPSRLVAHVERENEAPIRNPDPIPEKGDVLPPGLVTPDDQPPPRGKAPGAIDKEAAEALRTALGTLTGISIRQAYLNIGLLADGVEGEVYETDDATKVLDSVMTTLDTADRQLQQLPKGAFDEEDREEVALARKVLRLLREQAKELRAYWDDESEESAKRFQKARESSWEAIKELLEIDDE